MYLYTPPVLMLLLVSTLTACASKPQTVSYTIVANAAPAFVNQLPEVKWKVLSVANTDLSGLQAFIYFDSQVGNANGYSGCNSFNSAYTVTQQSLQFGSLMRTRMACSTLATNASEITILDALSNTRSYKIDRTVLYFFNQNNQIIATFTQ